MDQDNPNSRTDALRKRPLTAAQLSRRAMMQRLAATGGGAALAAALPRLVLAQASPAASPEASPVNGATPVPAVAGPNYDGPLATDQVISLPSGEPVTMDPGVSYGDVELDFFYNMYDGLMGIDQKTGEVIPRIAESFDINEDGSVYTFTLRDGVTWSDGTPLNANDFLYSWLRVLDPNTLSEYANAVSYIKGADAIFAGEAGPETLGVNVIDDLMLEVTLVGPTPFFPLLTTTWTYSPVPKHKIDELAEKWLEPAEGAPVVSNGPYVMTQWTHDQTIVLESNPQYYGEVPSVTRATYTLFEDQSTQAYIAFENDEVDYAAPEGPDLDRIVADPEAMKNVVEFPLSNCFFLVADATNVPTDNVQFRQALSKSINRDELANTVLRGQYLPAPTLLAPDIPGNNPDAGLAESVDEARALLAEAGIDPSAITLEFTYISTPARYKTVAEYLQATWQTNLGITVTLAPIEDAAYVDWRASRETEPFGVYSATWGSDFPDPANWINQNFTSQADHYRNKWVDADFDALAAKAAVNVDPASRDAQYQQLEATLLEAAPIIPMYRGKAFRIVKPWVKDLYFQSLLSVVHLRNVRIAEH